MNHDIEAVRQLMAAALPGLRPGDTVRPDRAHWRWTTNR